MALFDISLSVAIPTVVLVWWPIKAPGATLCSHAHKQNTPQFGLIAEEVAKVDPDLVVRDDNGEIYTVRYEEVNAMLLNEFLKEHRRVEQQDARLAKQETTIAQQKKDFASQLARQQKAFEAKFAQQQKQIEALTSSVQKVSDQVALGNPVAQLIDNH